MTHNLAYMADRAGLYVPVWTPEQIGIIKAAQMIEPLRQGLAQLKASPDIFRCMEPRNGWGTYDSFVEFLQQYLDVCERNPDATIRTCR